MSDATSLHAPQKRSLLQTLELDTRLLGMVGAFAVVCIIFNIITGGQFLTPRNIFNLTIQTVSVAIMATGMVFVIVTRHIDLSVGSVLATCSAVMAITQTQILPQSFGLGLGNSREKYGWLPAKANDYIFAIIGEELGLVGCIVVLVLFTLFAIGAFHVIRKTHDPFIRIVSGGITVWIVGQAIVNMGVVLRIFPVLGVPLPFMSQGGTSLLSVLVACGVLLSFARTLPARAAAPLAR